MHGIRNLGWFAVGLLVGLLSIAVATQAMKVTHGLAQATSPDSAGDPGGLDVERAELRIECRNDAECIKTSVIDRKDSRGALPRKFLRVRVYNDGSRTARGCRVTLRDVTEITPIGIVPTDYNGPSPLIWSGDRLASCEGKSIRPNANPAVVDLFYTTHRPVGDEITMKDQQYGMFLKFGRWYRFEIVASAENAKPASRTVTIRFGPSWEDFEVVTTLGFSG